MKRTTTKKKPLPLKLDVAALESPGLKLRGGLPSTYLEATETFVLSLLCCDEVSCDAASHSQRQ